MWEPNGSEAVNERRHNVLSGIGTVFEARHRCKNGTVRDFECSVSEMQVGPKTFCHFGREGHYRTQTGRGHKDTEPGKFLRKIIPGYATEQKRCGPLCQRKRAARYFPFGNANRELQVPESIKKIVEEVLENGNKHTLEIEVGSKTYLFTMAPFLEGGYVNVYSVDITERKHADQAFAG